MQYKLQPCSIHVKVINWIKINPCCVSLSKCGWFSNEHNRMASINSAAKYEILLWVKNTGYCKNQMIRIILRSEGWSRWKLQNITSNCILFHKSCVHKGHNWLTCDLYLNILHRYFTIFFYLEKSNCLKEKKIFRGIKL
jgi:hypothetical protein